MTTGTWPTGQPHQQAPGPAAPPNTQVLLTMPLTFVGSCCQTTCSVGSCMRLHVSQLLKLACLAVVRARISGNCKTFDVSQLYELAWLAAVGHSMSNSCMNLHAWQL